VGCGGRIPAQESEMMEWILNAIIILVVFYIAVRLTLAYFFPKDAA
jgi:hypothetical protein